MVECNDFWNLTGNNCFLSRKAAMDFLLRRRSRTPENSTTTVVVARREAEEKKSEEREGEKAGEAEGEGEETVQEVDEAEEGEKRCRLCYGGEEDGPLVQPCACRGSIKWIHEHCLTKWRCTSTNEDAAYTAAASAGTSTATH